MNRLCEAAWWYWAATVPLVAMGVSGQPAGIHAAMALTVVQLAHFAVRDRSLTSFPVQVRAAYLGLLAMGLWPPMALIHWIQLMGTTAMVLADYCPLARMLSLLPWNRTEPLSPALIARTFLARPGTPLGRQVQACALRRSMCDHIGHS